MTEKAKPSVSGREVYTRIDQPDRSSYPISFIPHPPTSLSIPQSTIHRPGTDICHRRREAVQVAAGPLKRRSLALAGMTSNLRGSRWGAPM